MFMVFLGSPFCGEKQTNLSQHSGTDDFERSMVQLKRIVYQIIAPILITTGLLGNILNLIVLGRPFLKGCTRIYLRALAIADFHVLLFEIPLIIRLNEIQDTSLEVAVYYAHFELVLVTTFIAFSSFIVTCLTVDRYISVCLPLMFTKIHTNTKAKITLAVSFLVAVTASAPLFLMKHVCQIDKCDEWGFQDNRDITDEMYWYVYLVASEVLIRIGPAITLAILNILIIRKFRIITRRRKNFLIPTQQFDCPTMHPVLVSPRRARKYHEERRLVILLQAIVLLFFLTMLPSSCLSFIYKDYHDTNLTFQIFRAAANLLEIANSALNFCVYFLCSRDFRKGLISILTGRDTRTDDATRNADRTARNGVNAVSVQNVVSNDSSNNVIVTSAVHKMEVSLVSNRFSSN